MPRRTPAFVLLAVSIVAMLACAAPPAAALAGTDRAEHYVAGTGTSHAVCRNDRRNPTARNLGVVCFPRAPGTEVELTLTDRSGVPVAAWARYTDGRGRVLGPSSNTGERGWPICGRAVIPTIANWSTLRVYLGVTGDLDACSALDGAHAATAGSVRASFSTGTWTPQPTPLRAGTIIDGEWATGPVGTCSTMPDCAAWRASGCSPALAGRNPALYSSIVDVADLADGATTRSFAARPGNPIGVQAGGISVQFWDADCRQVGRSLDPWNVDCHGLQWICDAEFAISQNARWMTVTSNGNAHMRWTLA